MTKIKPFNNFRTSFNKLIRHVANDLTRVNVEFYHHDFPSEPFLHLEANVENITIEQVSDYGNVITIFTPETMISFSESNYHTNISNDDVVFASKNDNETHCIISFI